ncbi:Rid family hydrolase [Paenibacillus yonginensis]|uniref:Rid family hydrolase n=1 Tax=Paenibacillus yonginensis TaxID=1462996 RepID=UPI000BFFF1E5|nr:Rid family hydrolase [Paenibacillus yonginensis]
MIRQKLNSRPFRRAIAAVAALQIFGASLAMQAFAAPQTTLSPNGVKTLAPEGAIQSTGTWNLGTRAGDYVYVAGMRGIDPKTNTLVADEKGRIRQAFLNMKLIAESEGASLQDATRIVVYVTDMYRYRPMVNEIQQELWGDGPYPPRTIIEVDRLNQDDIVEVEGTFYAPVNKTSHASSLENAAADSKISPNGVEILHPAGAIQSTGTWDLAARAGDNIYVAGMRGIDPKTNTLVADEEGRIRQAFLNMKFIAESEGATLRDASRIIVYTTDMYRYRPIVNKIQQELWGDGPYPPRTIIEVDRLNQDDIVEVEGTFYAPDKPVSNEQPAGEQPSSEQPSSGQASGGQASNEQPASGKIAVYVDGNKLNNMQAAVQNSTGVLVPLRSVLNAMGATVTWSGMNQPITVTQGELTAKFTVGSKSVLVNGQMQTMQAAVQITNNYAMIPDSLITEVFGAEVKWDGAARTLNITSKHN